MAGDPKKQGSALLLEELFEAGDPRFLDELRAIHAPKKLQAFVDKWKRDPRPFARAQIFEYLERPLDVPGHHTVVKRLFKNAEAARDDELMAAFLVAFDRLVRRVRKAHHHYDWQSRTSWTEEVLFTPRNSILPEKKRRYRDPMTGEEKERTAPAPKDGVLFSYHTRYYLRRRAWRYFRRLGWTWGGEGTDAYPPAIARALVRYRDADLARGENILDSWGLVHALFGKHEAIEFDASKANLRAGRALSELSPAPCYPGAWRKPGALEVLLGLVDRARARAVRVFAMEMLRREHRAGLAALAPERVATFFEHADEEVQQFGAELLDGISGLERLTVAQWLRLLATRNLTALETVAAALRKHVRAERLDLAQCAELAAAEPVPVARLGLELLRTKPVRTPAERALLLRLAGTRCAAVAGELTTFALSILGAPDAYHRDLVTPFFDSLSPEVRRAAWAWLVSEAGRPGYDDALLWVRFIETPFDDQRLRLVAELEKRHRAPFAGPGELAPVWAAVLLGVHRGGREKAKAVRQIGRALEEDSSRADTLLPILAVAIRSIRAPEMRAGLAALLSAVERRPELGDAVARLVPELKLGAGA